MKRIQEQSKGEEAPSVLIADDEPGLVSELGKTLREAGFRVATAGSVDEAFGQLLQRAFDVLILDVRMPQRSWKQPPEEDAGIVMGQLIQRLHLVKHETVVVLFTAFPSVSDLFAAAKAGLYYVPKTLMGEQAGPEMVLQCKRLVEEKRARRQFRGAWVEEHFDELVRRFGGKTVAVIDATGPGGDSTRGGIQIGDRRVFTAPTREKLKGLFVRSPKLRRAAPVLLTIPRGGEGR